MRQIVLDTETTGIDPAAGHRIIEIGCVEMMNRKLTGRTYHCYINPQREVEAEAIAVHGITNEYLADKPLFADIAQEFKDFIAGGELVIHNAPFDVGFINHEFALLKPGLGRVEEICSIIDTLVLARQIHPGQKNNLDVLCRRYTIDNSQRTLHGALLDAEILAEVYLMMTGGQTSFTLGQGDRDGKATSIQRLQGTMELPVISASDEELALHEDLLSRIDKKSEGSLWRR